MGYSPGTSEENMSGNHTSIAAKVANLLKTTIKSAVDEAIQQGILQLKATKNIIIAKIEDLENRSLVEAMYNSIST